MASAEEMTLENMFASTRKWSPAKERTSAPSEAFDAIYRRFVKPVYSFVAYRVSVRAEAEDVTSQIFEKAWRSYVTYDSGKALVSTWLFTIARNCVTDHLRRKGRSPGTAELDSNLGSAFHDGPEPRMEALELRHELREALTFLEDREREIIALKFGSSMSNRDIAALLDISESNAGTILYRSLQKMKSRLEGGNENA